MAQSLTQQALTQPEPDMTDSITSGGIDAAASRLEQAFARLEIAAKQANAGFHSLKADKEKLNLLLKGADIEILRLKEVTGTVVKRLDRTITALEKIEE